MGAWIAVRLARLDRHHKVAAKSRLFMRRFEDRLSLAVRRIDKF
jgi:hypothetical protein